MNKRKLLSRTANNLKSARFEEVVSILNLGGQEHELIEPEMKADRWNHNLHYNRVVLAAAPDRCSRALDVGCGEGMLTRELLSVSNRVVGIDVDSSSIELALARGSHHIEYVHADFLTHPFEADSFDLVVSVAALHHMDTESSLARMAHLVRPGGVIVVIGLARSRRLRDYAVDLAGAVATRVHKSVLRKRYWEHDAPKVWPPPLSYAELERTARCLLPGVKYRRHMLWRYSLVWRRPRSEWE